MAKRFTCTDKWKKRFLREMKAAYKLLWLYILDDCDHAGIWEVDFDVACIRIGEDVREDMALNAFGDRIKVFDGGKKWFLRDFIDFQYGDLEPNNRMHKSVIEKLKRYDLFPFQKEINEPLISPIQGAKEQEQYKDKEQVKDKEQEPEFDQLRHFEDFFKDYPTKVERSRALSVYCAVCVNKKTHDRIVKSLVNYLAHLAHENAESVWKKPKNPETWLEGWMDWESYSPPPKEKKYASKSERLIAKIKG